MVVAFEAGDADLLDRGSIGRLVIGALTFYAVVANHIVVAI